MSALAALCCWLAWALPRRLLLFVGRALGLLWFYLVPIRRAWTLAHLTAAGVGASPEERWRIARSVFIGQALNVVELLAWRRLRTKRGGTPSWIEVEGEHHLERARATGRPVVALTAHLGNFDLMGCHFGLTHGDLVVVSSRLSWRGLDGVWRRMRARCHLEVVSGAGCVPEALRALRAKRLVVLVLDQHASEVRAVERPFFGVHARTSAALATLAVRTGACIVPVFATRSPSGAHRLTFHPAIEPAAGPSPRARVEATTAQCLAIVEQQIRLRPAQWLWLHRRWKSEAGVPLVGKDGSVSCPEGELAASEKVHRAGT